MLDGYTGSRVHYTQCMRPKKHSSLRNITLSADSELIELARKKAHAAKTTLNEEFRNWLRQFTKTSRAKGWYKDFMGRFSKIDSGRKFKREEFYEE